ncbi:hypothetical protein DA803_00650 [[Mycoplasma] phocae]|uniref:Lipoprotein n=1 Tax=[Mycoplasma] phocae TaxID=142651 RepID=A0A2Z5IPP5_9BACT|nr:hypothetical protein [[Mycoplasma] phocae]AXE60605.1 hypothetical protein DA803_00650 [[Mycoplasma] phocae]
MKKKSFKWWIALPGVIFTLPLVAAACGTTNGKEIDKKPDQGNSQMDENKKPDNGNNQMNDGKKPDQEKDKMDGNKTPNPTPPEKKNDLEKYSNEIIYLNLYVLNLVKVGYFRMDPNKEELLKALNDSKAILIDLLDKKTSNEKEINSGLQLINLMINKIKDNTIKEFIDKDYMESITNIGRPYNSYLVLISGQFSNFSKEFNTESNNMKKTAKMLLKYWDKLKNESKGKINYKMLSFIEYLVNELKDPINEIAETLLAIQKTMNEKSELGEEEIAKIDNYIKEIQKVNQVN